MDKHKPSRALLVVYKSNKAHVTRITEDETFQGYRVMTGGKAYYVRPSFYKWEAKFKDAHFTDTLQQSNKSDSYDNPVTAIKRCIVHAHSP